MVPSTNENILPIAKDIVKEVRRNEKDVKKAGSARMSNKLRKRGPLPETEDCYFKVVDVSLDGTMIEDRGKCGFMRDLEMFYKTIPAQPKGTIRILLDGRPYSLGPRVTRPHLNCFDNGNDFVDPEPATTCPLYPSSRLPAESQHPHFVLFRNMWAEDGSSSCWHRTDAFVMHRLLCAHHPETKHLLQIETDMYEKSEIFVRVCRDIAGNPMVVCRAPDANIAWTNGVFEPKQCSSSNWRFLTGLEWSLRKPIPRLQYANRREQCAVQLLILHILELNLDQVSSFLDEFYNLVQHLDSSRMKGLSAPPPFFGHRLTGRIITLGNIDDSLAFISRSIDFVSTSIRLSSLSPIPTNPILSLESRKLDCDSRRDYVRRLKQKTTDTHNALADFYNRKQAVRVNQLTLLAAFFLPLSLAAAVLSMQNRLVDLHLLLYDFLGVVIILSTLAAFFAWINRFGEPICETIIYANYGHRADDNPMIRKALTIFWIVIWWAALLASFLTGMLKDIGLGLKILGFEAAGITLFWMCS